MSSKRNCKMAISKTTAGGVAKKGFSVIAEESEVVDYRAFFEGEPNYQKLATALTTGTMWGDICFPAENFVYVAPATNTKSVVQERPLLTELDFLAQPFAAALEQHCADNYLCGGLSDTEWESMMRWLYAAGWEITHESRACVTAYPDNQPAREWIKIRDFDALFESESQPVAPKQTKPKVTIPKFCRNGAACTDANCNWVHGDTLPVQNKVCGFDGRCSGEKRTTCCFLHPSEGEVWSESLVRHRPVVAKPAPPRSENEDRTFQLDCKDPPEILAAMAEVEAEVQPEIDAAVADLDVFDVEAV